MKRILLALALALAACGGSNAGSIIQGTRLGTGTAVLAWTAPSYNPDGSTISGLLGYNIYKSTASLGPYTLAGTVADPATLTYTVTGLTSGTWYFVVRSYNASGEGTDSAEMSKVIP